MEGRMAKIETKIEHIDKNIAEIKTDIRNMGSRLTAIEKWRWMITGVGLAISGGLGALIFKVFA